MVAPTSLVSELVGATIKYGKAPLEFVPEFAPNFYVQLVENLLKDICYLTV